ncbi:hypothetical protein BpHYR1_008564 [Brachionus plicatilis]|uniref:Uncharacterized protein n=1 Tax=Brachionus plicatilis TaxID=10195 RepID=A0A3M7RUC8_BRAPC|nr:hypothetical protein BpHYR1_008564 [Brachionus plicatilis]
MSNMIKPSKADSDKMSLLVLYKKEIFELDNIHYSRNLKAKMSLSQDESIRPEQVKKTGGKGKVYLPFCSFRNLESAQGNLAMTFADND